MKVKSKSVIKDSNKIGMINHSIVFNERPYVVTSVLIVNGVSIDDVHKSVLKVWNSCFSLKKSINVSVPYSISQDVYSADQSIRVVTGGLSHNEFIESNIVQLKEELLERNFQCSFTIYKSEKPKSSIGIILCSHHSLIDGLSVSHVFKSIVNEIRYKESSIYNSIFTHRVQRVSEKEIDFKKSSAGVFNLKLFNGIISKHESKRGIYRRSITLEKYTIAKIEEVARHSETTVSNVYLLVLLATLKRMTNELTTECNVTIAGRTAIEFYEDSLVDSTAYSVPMSIKINESAHDSLKNIDEIIENYLSIGIEEPVTIYNSGESPEITYVSEDYLNRSLFSNECVEALDIYSLESTSSKILLSSQHGLHRLVFTFLVEDISKDESEAFVQLYIKELNLRIVSSFEPAMDLISGKSTVQNMKDPIDYFYDVVNVHPGKLAIKQGNKTATYLELKNKAEIVAYHISKMTNCATVAIVSEPNIEVLVSMLAVWIAGKRYVPLDPSTAANRLEDIQELLNIDLFLSETPINRSYLRKGTVVKQLRELHNLVSEGTIETEQASRDAYLIYTSGSTGRPKAVPIPKTALCNYALHCVENYPVGFEKNIILHNSIAFDMSITCTTVPLMFGAQIEIVRKCELENYLKSKHTDLVKLTPSHMRQILSNEYSQLICNNIDTLIVGGEALDTKTCSQWKSIAPKTSIINEYGPTEATVGCVTYKFKQTDVYSDVPIGKPIQNTKCLVLRNGYSVDPYCIGELFIGGAGLARGYISDDSNSSESFIKVFDEVYYRTRDLAYYDKERKMHFLGRDGGYIKNQGYRIEIGYVTNIIKKMLNSSRLCITVNHERQILILHIDKDVSLTDDQVNRILSKTLAPYELPQKIIRYEVFAMDKNGKISLIDSIPIIRKKNKIKNKGMEKILKDTLSYCLNRPEDEIDMDSSFFYNGGNSVSAIKFVSLLRENHEILVSLKELYMFSSIRKMLERTER